MRCILCQRLNIKIFCKSCEREYLIPEVKIRLIQDIRVYSFYDKDVCDLFLSSKYYAIGSKVYKALSDLSAQCFQKYLLANQLLSSNTKPISLGIDSQLKRAYSHTAILLRSFNQIFQPNYTQLHAKNSVQYAGMSLEFRKNHPKGLTYSLGEKTCVVLDDIITTGTSMLEARDVIRAGGGKFLFGVTLFDNQR